MLGVAVGAAAVVSELVELAGSGLDGVVEAESVADCAPVSEAVVVEAEVVVEAAETEW